MSRLFLNGFLFISPKKTIFVAYFATVMQKKGFKNILCGIFQLSLISILMITEIFAQTPQINIQENYIHYTLESGLPTAVIYNCVQDKNGFMWFGSYAGLIRFDGHDFYTFTKQEGLPDNEIVDTNVDSLGRIWSLPFSKKPVYMYQNQLYTEKNDSILKKIENNNVLKFSPTKRGGIWVEGGIKEKYNYFYYIEKHQIKQYKIIAPSNIVAYNYIDTLIQIIGKDSIYYPQLKAKNIAFNFPNYEYSYQTHFESTPNGFYLLLNTENDCIIKQFRNNPQTHYPEEIRNVLLSQKIMSSYYHNEKLYVSFRAGGYLVIDKDFSELDTAQILQKEIYIGGMCVDNNGSLWLATMGDGIYCLPSHPIYKLKKEFKQNKTITQTIFKDEDGELFVGNSGGEIQRLNSTYSLNKNIQIGSGQYNRILHIEKSIFNPQDLYIICDEGFFIWHNYKKHSQEVEQIVTQATKSIHQSKRLNTIFIGTSGTLIAYNMAQKEKKVIIQRRITAISETEKGQLYFGGLDGLYKMENGTSIHIAAQNPRLNCRVIALLPYQENGFWVATSSDGLLLVKNDQVLLQINKARGLSTDMLTSLCQDSKGNLWAGSIKGLHKIEFEDGNFNKMHISFYNTQNGLLENTINDVKCWKDSIFVATYKGLCFFQDFQGDKKRNINTYITRISISGRDTLLQNSYTLPFDKNTLSISFTAICFEYNGEIYYHYRLLGKQNNWQLSNQKEVEFGALSAGEYVFEVYAMEELQTIKRIKFTILPPWWQRTWVVSIFVLLFFLAFLALSYSLFSLYQKRIHHKHQEEKRMKELEIQAIRAQMNPHFIFNCLNSIQYFVNNGEIDEANIYMDKFAKLIRKTLDFSQNAINSVADEISYIENYLQLEEMRFEDKFQHSIEVEDEIDIDDLFLPSLILQPFVENAIRHGLRYKEGKEGKLWVRFYEKEHFLVCEIEDNGIGREKAAELKSKQHIEYQSQGMLLSQNRLSLFNTKEKEMMRMEIVDLRDSQQNAAGTLIRVFISLDF